MKTTRTATAISAVALAFLAITMMPPASSSTAPNPVPLITFISPVSAVPGAQGFTLTVNGANFLAGSAVKWNGGVIETTIVNAGKLTAAVPLALISASGTATITVSNGSPALTSSPIYFPIGTPISTVTMAKIQIATGKSAMSTVVADFNNDGKLDLAVSNFDSSTVSVLLGAGDGTFLAAKNFSSVGASFLPAVGDVDGDGFLDMVVGSNGLSNMLVAKGAGDGTFPNTSSIANSPCESGPVLADVNGDGKLDIVVGNACSSGVSVYLGNGNGTFAAAIALGTTPGNVKSLIVADFNGDGKLDIAAAGNNGVYIYLAIGPETWGAPTAVAGIASAVEIAAGDFDGDGKVDLVASSQNVPGIFLLKGVGDGTFQTAVVLPLGPGQEIADNYYAVSAADLDADGNLDMIASTVSNVQVFTGNGAGSFHSPKILATGGLNYQLGVGAFVTGGSLGVAGAATGAPAGINVYLPTISISPLSIDFGSVNLGSTGQQIFAITNTTVSTVTITGITLGANGGDYSETDTCAAPLSPGAACTATVTFAPLAAGVRAAALTLADNAAGAPQAAPLTGTGVAAPNAILSLTVLTFGTQGVGVVSAPMPVTLTNTGTGALTGLAISVTGTNSADFGQTNNCSATLAVNASCTVSVTFTPGATEARSASLQFADNASNSPQSVALSGTGVLSPVKLVYTTAPPNSIIAGGTIGLISVAVETAQSMIVTNSNASIQVTITGPNGFSQSLTHGVISGVATFDFSAVNLNTAGEYTAGATSTDLQSTSAITTVTAKTTAPQMNLTGFPSPAFSNVAHTFTISVSDTFGNAITSYAGTVTLTSSDSFALFSPAVYTFVPNDLGARLFTGTLVTLGQQNIFVSDGVLQTAKTIQVNARPQFVVNAQADDGGRALCDGSEACSLRSAINQSNTLGAGDITVDTSQFVGLPPFTSTLANGALELNGSINITGPGPSQFAISADGESGVFQVDAGTVATISGLGVKFGSVIGNGGGIANAGTLTLTNVAVTNSTAGANGGGIYSTGNLTVNLSAISGNSATLNGGGIASSGTLTFYDSTISGNAAAGSGGGITNSGLLTVPQSTLSGNQAVDGSAIANEVTGTLTLAQSTVSGNATTGQAGATVANANTAPGAVTILNSIVAGNISASGDCPNCMAQVGFNVFDVAAGTLNLGALADNGGPTNTMVPAVGSPVIGAGSVALALSPGVPQSLANDQRGEGFVRVVNASVD